MSKTKKLNIFFEFVINTESRRALKSCLASTRQKLSKEPQKYETSFGIKWQQRLESFLTFFYV